MTNAVIIALIFAALVALTVPVLMALLHKSCEGFIL